MKNKTGNTYGRLTVIKFSHYLPNGKSRQPGWECQCECGNTAIIGGGNLASGRTQSCGCLKQERIKLANTKENPVSKMPEYSSWKCMKQRCLNPNDTNYSHYGGRGITIHLPWLKFKSFIHDMGIKPEKNMEIDRKNVNGNYTPTNCRWQKKNAGKKRDSVLITYAGKTQSLTDWANELCIPRNTLDWRRINGWSIKRMMTN